MTDKLTLSAILEPHNADKVGIKLSNSKAKHKANDKARLNCKRLAKGTPEQQEIAEKAEGCTRRKPCRQPSCPKCLFWAQQVMGHVFAPTLVDLLESARKVARQADQSLPMAWAFSAVDEEMSVQRGHLKVKAIIEKNEAIHSILDASPLCDAPALYGLDVSLNALIGSRSFWQPQYYGLIFAPDKEMVRDCLSPLFPQSGGRWQKPLIIKELPTSDFPDVTRYVVKPNVVRRESYLGRNGRRQTAKRDLKANEEVEIATFLQKLGLRRRLQLRGLRIVDGQLKAALGRKPGT